MPDPVLVALDLRFASQPRNLYPRSGLLAAGPSGWWVGAAVRRGAPVTNDAAPEVGVEMVEKDDDLTNHTMGWEMDSALLEMCEPHTLSLFVRSQHAPFVYLRTNSTRDSGASQRTFFNLAIGQLAQLADDHSRPFIQDVGNRVYRVGVTFEPMFMDTVAKRQIVVGAALMNGVNAYTGTPDYVALELFHAQIERGIVASEPQVTSPRLG